MLIAQHAQLTGTFPITIGSHTVIHPHSKLSSGVAPVVVGEGCVVYERAKVGVGVGPELDAETRRTSIASARSSINPRESMRADGTFLGKNVVVESNATVEAADVGEGSIIEVGATLGRGSIIGKYCTISAFSVIPPFTQIPDYTVVFSGSERRIDQTLILRPELLAAKLAMHKKQLEMFKKLIPNNVAKWVSAG